MKLEAAVLTFAANGLWQLFVLAAGALVCRPLVARLSPRLQCRFWGAAILAGVTLPALSASWVVLGRPPAMPILQLRPDTLVTWARLVGVLVAVSSAVTLRRWIATSRIQRATVDAGERVHIVAALCARTLGVAPVPVRLSSRLASPVTLGARRPVIMLPPHLGDETSTDLLRTALGHELAHIRRRDFAWSVALDIVAVPLAWHPIMRWFKRRLTATRELACDDLVAGPVVEARVYARSLVSLAQMAMGDGAAGGALGILDGHSLEVRIDRLLSRGPSPRPSRWTLATFVLLAAAAVGCQHFSVLFDRCYLHPQAASVQAVDLCVRVASVPLG